MRECDIIIESYYHDRRQIIAYLSLSQAVSFQHKKFAEVLQPTVNGTTMNILNKLPSFPNNPDIFHEDCIFVIV